MGNPSIGSKRKEREHRRANLRNSQTTDEPVSCKEERRERGGGAGAEPTWGTCTTTSFSVLHVS
jgi:hypothetical protein